MFSRTIFAQIMLSDMQRKKYRLADVLYGQAVRVEGGRTQHAPFWNETLLKTQEEPISLQPDVFPGSKYAKIASAARVPAMAH